METPSSVIVLASFASVTHAVRRVATYFTSPLRYPGRHWSGRLSVGRSLVLNWLILGEVASGILQGGADVASAPLVDAPPLYAIARLPFYCLSLAIWVWGAVGTWRSLGCHGARRRGRWTRYAGRSVIALGIATLLMEVAAHHVRFASLRPAMDILVGSAAKHPTRFERSSDHRRMAMIGPITRSSASELRRLLDDDARIETLDLSSSGGRVLSAFEIADDVKRRALNTNVLDDCTSACTIILLAGAERTAPVDASIGFHATTSSWYNYADGALRAYFLGFGLSEAFVDHAMGTPNTSMWYPPIETLLEERILTRANDPED